ncbi:MAG: permease, partial [Tumebacillaceae bacterium]
NNSKHQDHKQPVSKHHVQELQMLDHHEHDQHKHDQHKHDQHEHGQHEHGHHGHDHSRSGKLMEVMGHSISEFFEMGKYLMFGAMLVALLQTFVSRDSLTAIGHGQVGANLLMMGLGFILSLCSTSDAFVAQSFIMTFSKGSLVAFMVLGPMLNLKGLLMMSAVFKPKFVVLYSLLVVVFVFAGTSLLEWLVL